MIRSITAVLGGLAVAAMLSSGALAQTAKPKKASLKACPAFDACVARGMNGNNQYNTKYDRATAESYCSSRRSSC